MHALRNTILVEKMTIAAPTGRVDRNSRVIRGVKVLGLKSRNSARVIGIDSDEPYSYSLEALRSAIPLYENCKVFIDHPVFAYDSRGGRRMADGDRQVKDYFGRLVNVRVAPDGLYADLEYLATHPLAESVLEVAERMPEQLAMSHHAYTRPTVKADGSVVIEHISEVHSVDLIAAKPGTTASLFESMKGSDMKQRIESAAVAEESNSVREAFIAEIEGHLRNTKLTAAECLQRVRNLIKTMCHALSVVEGINGVDREETPDDAPEESLESLAHDILHGRRVDPFERQLATAEAMRGSRSRQGFGVVETVSTRLPAQPQKLERDEMRRLAGSILAGVTTY